MPSCWRRYISKDLLTKIGWGGRGQGKGKGRMEQWQDRKEGWFGLDRGCIQWQPSPLNCKPLPGPDVVSWVNVVHAETPLWDKVKAEMKPVHQHAMSENWIVCLWSRLRTLNPWVLFTCFALEKILNLIYFSFRPSVHTHSPPPSPIFTARVMKPFRRIWTNWNPWL